MSKSQTMSIVSSAVFWGVIIIFIGLSIILKEVFHINFPFLRVLFGLLLIFWGIKVISGRSWKSKGENNAIFSSANMNYDEQKQDYNIVFGSGNVDLFKSDLPEKNKKIEVNVVFGEANLILNDSIPSKVEMSSVFGSVRADDREAVAFGSSTFTTSAFKESMPYYKIKANAVFGSIKIENKKW